MTAETKATDTDKPKVVRITVPATDEVTMDFLEAQGPRGVTTAVRLLIHSFVAEHGNVDVLSAVSGSLVGTRPVTPAVPQDQDADTSDTSETVDAAEVEAYNKAYAEIGASEVPVSDTDAGKAVADTPDVPDTVTGGAPDTTPDTTSPVPTSTATGTGVPDGGSPVSDMEDLFRQAGKK